MQRGLLLLAFLFSAFAASIVSAQTVTFNGSFAPYGGSTPIEASDGNFYEIAYTGGYNSCGGWCLERITPGGVETTVAAIPDSGLPTGSIIEGSDGIFYGLTDVGTGLGNGLIYTITPSGTPTILYTFCSQTYCTDGDSPVGGLVEGTDGNFYGTTARGGYCAMVDFATTCNSEGYGGVVYKITPTGNYSVLYEFPGGQNNSYPNGNDSEAALIQATDGNFYGTTYSGGSGCASTSPAGTIFQMTPSGSLTTLYTFCYASDSTPGSQWEQYLMSGMAEGPDGNLYGVTGANVLGTGDELAVGWLYSISLTGTFTNLHLFGTTGLDTGDANSAPIWASDGNLYGTTSLSSGSIYEYSSTNGFSVPFDLVPPAAFAGSPAQGNDGKFYGAYGLGGDGPPKTYQLALSPALSSPVQLTLSTPTLTLGNSATLTWNVLNAFSQTMSRCFATGPVGGGSWSGIRAARGSTTLTPTAVGKYTYALTCGGVESGFATITVIAPTVASSTALTAIPDPSSVGQPVTLKAVVSGSNATPTGSVAYSVYGNNIATVDLSNGSANLTVPTYALPAGMYPIVATYSGSSTYNASSVTSNVVINAAPTITTLQANPNPVTPPASVTFTATVKRSASGASGTPTGSVGFYFGANLLDTAAVNASGVAAFTVSTNGLPAGNYPLTAKYLGDGSDVASVSQAVSVVVK